MTPLEVRRRCKALLNTPPSERPVSVESLQEIAGTENNSIWRYANGKSDPNGKAYVRLDRAFRLLESGQIEAQGKYRKATFAERDPKPKQVNVLQLRMTESGIQSGFSAVNPNAFTALPRLIEPLPGTETKPNFGAGLAAANQGKLAKRLKKG